jgi:hypothetical protein
MRLALLGRYENLLVELFVVMPIVMDDRSAVRAVQRNGIIVRRGRVIGGKRQQLWNGRIRDVCERIVVDRQKAAMPILLPPAMVIMLPLSPVAVTTCCIRHR